MTTPTGSTASSFFDQTTGNASADGLIYGTRWATHTLTYSFATPGASFWSTDPLSGYGPSSGDGEPWAGLPALTSAEKTAVRSALHSWANVANLSFLEATDSSTTAGDIRFGFSSQDK